MRQNTRCGHFSGLRIPRSLFKKKPKNQKNPALRRVSPSPTPPAGSCGWSISARQTPLWFIKADNLLSCQSIDRVHTWCLTRWKREASEETRQAERDKDGGKDSPLFSLFVISFLFIYFSLFLFFFGHPSPAAAPANYPALWSRAKRVWNPLDADNWAGNVWTWQSQRWRTSRKGV